MSAARWDGRARSRAGHGGFRGWIPVLVLVLFCAWGAAGLGAEEPVKRFGIGAALELHPDGGAVVKELVAGGAAARQGDLRAGDRIVAVRSGPDVEWKDLPGMDLPGIIALIVGSEGTPVALRVAGAKPGASTRTITITRGALPAPAAPAQAQDLAATPMLRLNPEMHTAVIRRIAVDRDQTLLATASDDKTVRLWDLREGQAGELRRVLRLPGDEGNVGKAFAVALSPDGATVAVGGFQVPIYFHDTATGRLRQRLGGLPNVILHLAWSPDGRWLVACLGAGNGIRVYDVAGFAGKAGEELAGTGSRSATMKATEVFADAEYGDFDSYWADFHPGGGTFATTCLDGKVRLYRVPGGNDDPGGTFARIAAVPAPGGERPFSVAHSPDGRFLAVGYAETTRVDVLHAADLRPAYQPDTAGIGKGDLFSVAWSPGPGGDGPARLLAAGTYVDGTGDQPVIIWEDAGRGARSAWPGTPNTVMQLLPLRQGRVLLASTDPAWKLLDPAGKPLLERTAETGDFRAIRAATLHLDEGATSIRFALDGTSQKEIYTFSAAGQRWLPPAGLHPPVQVTAGFKVEDWEDKTTPTLDGNPLPLQRYETSRSLAIAPDDAGFLLGTEWQLYAFDREGAVRWQTAAPGIAWSVNVSGDGRFAVAAFADGTIRWYRYADGTPLLNFFPRKAPSQLSTTNPQPTNDWILWAPEGWFASSGPDAESLMGWQINRSLDQAPDFYGGNQIREVFLDQSGILKRVLQECRPAGEIAADLVKDGTLEGQLTLEEALTGIPLVELIGPDDLAAVPAPKVDFTVRARVTDPSRPLDTSLHGGIQLRLDGTLIRPDSARFKPLGDGWFSQTYTGVELSHGRNLVEAVAVNYYGISSAPETRRLFYDGPVATSRLFVLGAGVEAYSHLGSLPHCKRDVLANSEALRLRGRDLFAPKPDVVFLGDGEVTRERLETEFRRLAAAMTPHDTFVFLFAGHGGMGDAADLKPGEPLREEFYLATHDMVAAYGPEARARGIAASQLVGWLKAIPARRKVLVLDACHSGAFIQQLETGTNRAGVLEGALYELYKNEGTAVFASTGADDTARSAYDLALENIPAGAGHAEGKGFGLFSYAFLEGLLLGKADAAEDGRVDVQEMESWVKGRLGVLSRTHGNREQRAVTYVRPGVEFPLGLVAP